MTGSIEVGLGALRVLSVPGRGQVAATYPRAAYLRLPAGLVALTSFAAPSGPGHARSSISLDGLRVDDRVTVVGSLLQAGPVMLDLEGARIWRGAVPTAAELQVARGFALNVLERAPASSLTEGEVGCAVELLRQGDIAQLAAVLGGLGTGLTPSGDDLLAGVFMVARIRWEEAAEPLLVDAAAMVETNDIARMFLHWAAKGQSIEPVHRFLASAVRSDIHGALSALEALITFGHSSGADLALGLRLGLELLGNSPLPIPPSELAPSGSYGDPR